MDPFSQLLTSSSGPAVSPEMLEMIGKKAAELFLRQGVPLNDGISRLIAEHSELGNEHVKRVVEFANNFAFQELFEKSPDKNVHFDVADPGVVIRDSKDGGSPAHDGKTMASTKDYLAPPSADKGEGADDLAHLFAGNAGAGPEMQAKLASAKVDHSQHANPVEDVYDQHVRLQAAQSELELSNERFDLLLKQASEELYQVIKNEILDPYGAGMGGVIKVLEKVASFDPTDVLRPMTERLLREGVGPMALAHSLEKRAGAVINQAHPLVMTWAGLEKIAYDKRKTEMALEEISRSLEKTSAFLRSRR